MQQIKTKNKRHDERRAFFGAGDEARTRYLHLGKVALYQMSYTRNSKTDYSGQTAKSQAVIS